MVNQHPPSYAAVGVHALLRWQLLDASHAAPIHASVLLRAVQQPAAAAIMAAPAARTARACAHHQHGLQSSHQGPTHCHQACDTRCVRHTVTRSTVNASTDDVIVQFVRSSGAGGQNVNKVSTKVDMRFNVRKTPWLEDDVKEAVERMVGDVCVLTMAG